MKPRNALAMHLFSLWRMYVIFFFIFLIFSYHKVVEEVLPTMHLFANIKKHIHHPR